jgi:hypothetical protein
LQHEHANLLDRFHPLKRLRRFRGQSVPAIDYWLTKLNIQMSLIDDLRARPDQFGAASTAFVTFERVEDSIRAKRELGGRHLKAKAIARGGKVLEFRVKAAPEARDLHWDQLVVVSLHADLVRGTILQVVIWGLTIVWVSCVFPLALLALDLTRPFSCNRSCRSVSLSVCSLCKVSAPVFLIVSFLIRLETSNLR